MRCGAVPFLIFACLLPDDAQAHAFDEAVYKSLAATVKQVNEKENFTFINHQLQTDTLLKRTKNVLKLKAKHKIPKAFTANEDLQISVNHCIRRSVLSQGANACRKFVLRSVIGKAQ